jgi:hypothetical protein
MVSASANIIKAAASLKAALFGPVSAEPHSSSNNSISRQDFNNF